MAQEPKKNITTTLMVKPSKIRFNILSPPFQNRILTVNLTRARQNDPKGRPAHPRASGFPRQSNAASTQAGSRVLNPFNTKPFPKPAWFWEIHHD
jgi:hypothetical protein